MDSEPEIVDPDRLVRERQIVFDREHIRGAKFSGINVDQLVAFNSRLEQCRFDRTTISQAVFGAGRGQSNYVDCTFNNVRIRFGPAGDTRFVGCSFHESQLQDWFCFAVELVDCRFTGRLERAVFNGNVDAIHRRTVNRERNEFRDNDFSGMDLIDVAFRTGIDLSQQRLPRGPDYLYLPNAAVTIMRSRAEVLKWEERDLRNGALTFLGSLEQELEGGQHQHLLRMKDYYGCSAINSDTLDLVFRALKANA